MTLTRHYIELVCYKAYADLRAEAARAYLGVLWWVLEPLLYMTVFYLVFGLLLQRGGKGFVSFLLCGLVIWRWFASSVSRGANAIPSNAGLMLQVYLPKYLFPSMVLIANSIKFLIVLVLLLIYLVIVESSLHVTWTALPFLLVTQLLLIAACASLLAVVVPFAPDLRILIENGLALLFFMSGVFYDIREFPAETQAYFDLNPMAVLIENYRGVLLEGAWPDWQALGMVMLVAALGICLALYWLTRYDRVYPKAVVQ
jgi:lipopolysaccharide transport system permease protein